MAVVAAVFAVVMAAVAVSAARVGNSRKTGCGDEKSDQSFHGLPFKLKKLKHKLN